MKALTPLSAIKENLYPPETEVAFTAGESFRWDRFTRDLATLRALVSASPKSRWIVNSDHGYRFACAYLAILQCGRELLLTANMTPAFLAELLDGDTGLLADEAPESVGDAIVPIPPALAAGSGTVAGGGAPATGGDSGPAASLAFPRIDPEAARITLYTSGSTGKPKAFPKRLTELETEVSELAKIWSGALEGRRVWSTVNHHHIYGFLFFGMLPLSLGIPMAAERVNYPETLLALDLSRVALVGSPAFYKRVAQSGQAAQRPDPAFLSFSSGGALSEDVARRMGDLLGNAPTEIYGSTETGGIAYRRSVEGPEWTPFPRNGVSAAADGKIAVRSPYILDPEGFVSGDLGDFLPDGRFILLGRADSIVKIEEKRVSLTEVENRLRESPLVSDACVIAMAEKRQFLAAAVALSPEGSARFEGAAKRDVNAFFTDHLRRYLEATVIPKRWRFVPEIPRNAQDKVLRDEIEALFAEPPARAADALAGVRVAKTENTETGLVIELAVGAESPYFDGHFPEYKILPAVAQFDLVMRFAADSLGIRPAVAAIPRVKFKKPIRPEAPLILSIDYSPEKGTLAFSYADKATGDTYSGGKIQLETP